jgi:hypothetical protein
MSQASARADGSAGRDSIDCSACPGLNSDAILKSARSYFMVHRLSIAKAKSSLGRLVQRAHANREYFVLEKNGVALAGILGAEELEDYLELRNPWVRRQIEGSNDDIVAGRSRPASELLAEVRARRRGKPARVRGRRT